MAGRNKAKLEEVKQQLAQIDPTVAEVGDKYMFEKGGSRWEDHSLVWSCGASVAACGAVGEVEQHRLDS